MNTVPPPNAPVQPQRPLVSPAVSAREIQSIVHQGLAAQLHVIKQELADLRTLAGAYDAMKRAFFRGRREPLSIPNIDELMFAALIEQIRFVAYDPVLKRMVMEQDGVVTTTDGYFPIFLEIFARREYGIVESLAQRPYVVYDFGMNRGYAALWFAKHEHCRAVYGFEPFAPAYEWALSNFALNPAINGKISAFPVGLGGADREVEFLYEPDSDGVSTVSPEFYASFWTEGRKAKRLSTTLKLRKASAAVRELPLAPSGAIRVLKIDVEGAEYEILKELRTSRALDFDLILAEAHLGLPAFLELVPDYEILETRVHSDLVANVALVRRT